MVTRWNISLKKGKIRKTLHQDSFVLIVCVYQEYQEHHSEEEDADIYEKIPNTDEKVGGAVDKRKCKYSFFYFSKKKKQIISDFNCGMSSMIVLQLDR